MAGNAPTRQAGPDILAQNKRKSKITEREALDLIESRSSTTDRGRDPTHLALQQQWFVSVAYFAGISDFERAGILRNIDPNLVPPKTGYKANHLHRIVMAQAARLVQSDPVMDCIPKSPDPDDQHGAKVGSYFLQHFDDQLNMRGLKRELAFWLVTCGNGFMLTDWDTAHGEEIRSWTNPFDNSPMRAENLSPEIESFLEQNGGLETRHEGDLDMGVLSPFQVIVPRGYRDMKRMPWVCFEYERSLDWVWDRYPKKAKNVGETDFCNDPSVDGQYWDRLGQLVNRPGYTHSSSGTDRGDVVRVREMWVPPSGRFPSGFFIRATRSMVLDHGAHPYATAGVDLRRHPWMRFPLTHFRYAPMPGRFWGLGLVEHLIAAQNDYDRARHQIIMQRDILAQPQWLKPAGVTLTTLRNEYGDMWEYEGNGKPELQNPPPMSQIHADSMERSLADMRMISAQGEATQGDVPPGLRSGVAIRYLQEKDTSVLAPVIQDVEEGFEDVAKKQLVLTHTFMDLPRAINIYGETRQADIAIFKGSDLNGNVFVRVRRGSMTPKSKAETAELVMELAGMGAIDLGDPDQREFLFSAMEVGGTDKFFLERNLDRRRADIENQMFLRPQVDPVTGTPQPPPDVSDLDDHEVHYVEHRKFMKTDAYEVLPPMRKLLFEGHMRKHELAIAQAVQTQMMMAAGPGMMGGAGGPPSPGGGSPPKPPGEASQPRKRQETPGSTKNLS